jgi:hypothetical protein
MTAAAINAGSSFLDSTRALVRGLPRGGEDAWVRNQCVNDFETPLQTKTLDSEVGVYCEEDDLMPGTCK